MVWGDVVGADVGLVVVALIGWLIDCLAVCVVLFLRALYVGLLFVVLLFWVFDVLFGCFFDLG